MPAPPLHASSRGAQARRRLAPRQYRPQRRRPRRRSTSIARSAIRGANSPGASSTAQVGVCDAIRPQTSLPTKRQARGPQSFQAQGMIATESVGVTRSRLGSRAARAATGSRRLECRDARRYAPPQRAGGRRQIGCNSHLHPSSPLPKGRIQAAAPETVSSKPRSRPPIAKTPPSNSVTTVQAALRPPSGSAAPLPGTLNDPGVVRSHSRCHGHLLQTPPPPFQAPHHPSPRRPRLPKPPDPAPADLAPLLTPPRMPPSTASGIILGGLNPPGGLRGRSRWRSSMPQTPRPPFRVPWIPPTKSAATCSGALKPIGGPKASQGPRISGV